MQKRVKSFFRIAFSVMLLISLVNLVLAEETDWGAQVNSALESVPQGTSQYGKAIEIYQKYNDDSNRLYREEMPNTLDDPIFDECWDACGPMPNPSPTDIDIDNPDAWSQNNELSFDAWEACHDKCNAEKSARDKKLDEEFDEKMKQLAEKAIADINTIKGGGTVTPGSGTFNTNSNRGRDEFGRMNPSIGGYLGDAYVVRSDGTKVIPGKELYLKVEDKLTTGKNSNLNLIFKDVGGINLGPNTQLRVGNALLDQYYLARGSLKTQINWGTLPPQKLEFHTPNVVINVKGTEFIIDYNETSNVTAVYLNEGNLEVEIRNQIVNLAAGNYLVTYPTGETWQYLLKPEKWEDLSNNFYEIPDVDKRFNYIVLMIDLIVIFILFLWMKKKIKNLDKNDKSTSKGTVSLVLGILGIVLILIAPYIGIIFSAIGFCLSKIQKANKPTRIAIAGFFLGIMGMALNMLFLITAL